MKNDAAHHALRHGPEVTAAGVDYRLWSPDARAVSVLIGKKETGGSLRQVPLIREPGGWFVGLDPKGAVGDLYRFLIDEKTRLPDVASRFQPAGVHGPSQVVQVRNFHWSAQSWKRPPLHDLVIYELHVGTFTQTGTFASALKRLAHVRELGANAIELMPVGAFPGERNWGYDVVFPFAPANAYGEPDDLRRFVDAAHNRGLAVIMDVVYNHFCGEPNIMRATSPHYFRTEGANAWGSSLNFDGEHSAAVSAFYLQNAVYWLDEFHVDGLRLDATHAIADDSPTHILQEIADTVHQRGGLVIAEDDRNEAKLLLPKSRGGLGLDAAWADDFHHTLKMALKPEPIGHFKNYRGTTAELVDTLDNGWLFRGQKFIQWNKPRGTECHDLAPEQFVYCISNHDQSGNRPLGERLSHLVSAEAYRAASMFFLLLPYTPMLFMGQEWAAATPFVFFSNHDGDFGAMVSEGRRREFEQFGSQWPAAMLEAMPNPEQAGSFLCSKLDWSECEKPVHAYVLELYRECLRLRGEDPVLRRRERKNWKVWSKEGCVFLRYGSESSSARLLVARFNGIGPSLEAVVPATAGTQWKLLLSSNENRFGGRKKSSAKESQDKLKTPVCETILLGKDL